MKKQPFRKFEIDAIVSTIISKIKEKKMTQPIPANLIKISNEIKDIDKAMDELSRKRNKLYNDFSIVSKGTDFARNGDGEVFFHFQSYPLITQIETEVVVANIENKDLSKLIDKLVKKFS